MEQVKLIFAGATGLDWAVGLVCGVVILALLLL